MLNRDFFGKCCNTSGSVGVEKRNQLRAIDVLVSQDVFAVVCVRKYVLKKYSRRIRLCLHLCLTWKTWRRTNQIICDANDLKQNNNETQSERYPKPRYSGNSIWRIFLVAIPSNPYLTSSTFHLSPYRRCLYKRFR